MVEQTNLSATGSRPTGYSFQATMPGIANYYTVSATGMCCPGSEPYRIQRPTLIGQHHAQLPPAPIGQHHAPWPRPPEQHHDQVDLTGRDDLPQPEPEIGADKHTEESTSTAQYCISKNIQPTK